MDLNKENIDGLGKDELAGVFDLLSRYSAGQCSEKEIRAVESWYESLSGESEMDSSHEASAKREIWSKIKERSLPEEERKSGSNVWLRWAASVMIVVGAMLGIYLTVFRPAKELSFVPSGSPDWQVITNATTATRSVLLPDSSQVLLSPNAVFGFPHSFGTKERVVHLKGEAFFDVKRNPSHPFKVITGPVVTRVLGTSFTVRAIEGAPVVEVDVRTGKVSVYAESKSGESGDGVVLTPNQKVTFYKDDSKFVTDLVENPQPSATNANQNVLAFKNQSMRNVLTSISNEYYIEILVSNDDIYDCTFTGDVAAMPLHDMLKVICRSIGASYEVKGTRILIDGKGCR